MLDQQLQVVKCIGCETVACATDGSVDTASRTLAKTMYMRDQTDRFPNGYRSAALVSPRINESQGLAAKYLPAGK